MEKLSDIEIQELLDNRKNNNMSGSNDKEEDIRLYSMIYEELHTEPENVLSDNFSTKIATKIFIEVNRKRDFVYSAIISGIIILSLGIILIAFSFFNLFVNVHVQTLITSEMSLLFVFISLLIIIVQFADKIFVLKPS